MPWSHRIIAQYRGKQRLQPKDWIDPTHLPVSPKSISFPSHSPPKSTYLCYVDSLRYQNCLDVRRRIRKLHVVLLSSTSSVETILLVLGVIWSAPTLLIGRGALLQ